MQIVKGYGIYEDNLLKFGIFQGSREQAEQMLRGFQRAPLNKRLNLTLKEITADIKEMN